MTDTSLNVGLSRLFFDKQGVNHDDDDNLKSDAEESDLIDDHELDWNVDDGTSSKYSQLELIQNGLPGESYEDFLERYRESDDIYAIHNSDTFDLAALPSISDISLWWIPVPVGQEETVVYNIFDKLLVQFFSGRHLFGVISIFGRVSLPGSIFIEAREFAMVRRVCLGSVPDGAIDCARVVPVSEASGLLHISEGFTPASPGWIRLKRGLYKDDLAFITDVDDRTLQVEAVVVPRISLSKTKERKSRSSRPPQQIFDKDRVGAIYDPDSVTQLNQVYKFQNRIYKNGFLELNLDRYHFHEVDAIPTYEELEIFGRYPGIDIGVFAEAYRLAGRATMKSGDRVVIVSGQHSGLIGLVQMVDVDEIEVYLDTLGTSVALHAASVRRSLRVGDEVKIKSGQHTGLTGWVVRVELDGTKVHISEHTTNTSVTVADVEVEFCQFNDEISIRLPSNGRRLLHDIGTSSDTIQRNRKDPLIGLPVTVTGKHDLKGYHGLVKVVCASGDLQIEMEATHRTVQVPRNRVSLRGSLVQLNMDAPRNTAVDTIPVSAQPLVPSTPFPEAMTGSVSPAWDPSSRTPCVDLGLGPLPTTWLLAPELSGKKVKLIVKGTKVPPIFKGGQYEGRVASLVAVNPEEPGIVRIRFLPKCDTMSIEYKYLEPFPVSAVGEKVVVIRGAMIGSEYLISNISDDEFSLADPSTPKVVLSTQPRQFLAVLSKV